MSIGSEAPPFASMVPKTNAEQIDLWNGAVGARWAAEQARFDRAFDPFGRMARDRAAPQAGERAIDIGCGCGATTLLLADAVGPRGNVVGVDVSEPMLAIARLRAAAHPNVSFISSDASTHRFETPANLLFSRFGVMFFHDPAAAFTHLRAPLARDGRLVFVCWRALTENPWMTLSLDAVASYLPPMPPTPADAPGPFAFADRARLAHILATAGFTKIDIDPYDSEVLFSEGDHANTDEAIDFAMQIGPLSQRLRMARDAARALDVSRADARYDAVVTEVRGALRKALDAGRSPRGIGFPGAVWLVSAR